MDLRLDSNELTALRARFEQLAVLPDWGLFPGCRQVPFLNDFKYRRTVPRHMAMMQLQRKGVGSRSLVLSSNASVRSSIPAHGLSLATELSQARSPLRTIGRKLSGGMLHRGCCVILLRHT